MDCDWLVLGFKRSFDVGCSREEKVDNTGYCVFMVCVDRVITIVESFDNEREADE